jgi:hypothetical protein
MAKRIKQPILEIAGVLHTDFFSLEDAPKNFDEAASWNN